MRCPNPGLLQSTDILQMKGDWTVKLALLGRFGALRHRHLRIIRIGPTFLLFVQRLDERQGPDRDRAGHNESVRQ